MAKEMTISKWRARVKAQERSGLTQKAWCEREGLALSSLALWRQRFRGGVESSLDATDQASVKAGRGLVPIVVRESAVAVRSDAAGACDSILIESGTLRLCAASGTDPRWLGALLRELGA